MKRLLMIGAICMATLTSGAPGLAQERTKTAAEAEAGTFAWGHGLAYVRNHFVKAAEEFPEDKYGYRPTLIAPRSDRNGTNAQCDRAS
jgi:hypothetical protein